MARIPPKLWARFPTKFGLDTPATTNGCESYHRHLKDHVGTAHPNVYKFAMILLERQELTYVKLQGLAAQRRPDSLMKLREIKEHCDNLTRGHLTSYEFIHKLSFKFLPVID